MKNYLNANNNKADLSLQTPTQIIKNGGIVVFPTETVYGIGVNGLDENAIKRLYKIKNRPLNKPISLLIGNIEMIEQVAKNISKEEYILIKEFMPGPLTLVLEKSDIVPDILTANSTTVGVRMPANDIALELINLANVPLATSSANFSGEDANLTIENIIDNFKNSVDYYIDGGECEIGVSSTVIKIVDETPYILREGSITKKQILEALNKKEAKL